MTPSAYFLAAHATLCALTAAWYRRRLLTERETSAGLRRDLLAQSDAHAEELSKAEVDGFADGWEACVEEAEERLSERPKFVYPEIACDCPRCREKDWAVN